MRALVRALWGSPQTTQTQRTSPRAQVLTRDQQNLVNEASKYKSLVQTAGLLLPKEEMVAFLNDALADEPNLRDSHLQCHKITSNNMPTLQQRTVQEYKTLTSKLKTYICASPNFTKTPSPGRPIKFY